MNVIQFRKIYEVKILKNHEFVDVKLLQVNKKFSHLKQSQKEKIHNWLYEAYEKYASKNIKEEEIFDIVFSKIDDADIWIPKGEVIKYYHSHKSKFKKRYEKSKCKEYEIENREE